MKLPASALLALCTSAPRCLVNCDFLTKKLFMQRILSLDLKGNPVLPLSWSSHLAFMAELDIMEVGKGEVK